MWSVHPREGVLTHQEGYMTPQAGCLLFGRDLALLIGHILLPDEPYSIPDVLSIFPDVPTTLFEVPYSPS